MDKRPYDLNRPAHLIAAQVIRDIEAIAGVSFGPQSSAPVEQLVEQYRELLLKYSQGITDSEAKDKGFKCRRCREASFSAPCLMCSGCHKCCTCFVYGE